MLTALTALFSIFKLGKVGVTGLSMILSMAVYASIWGWTFAAGFIALLFAHEMGHVWAARLRGLPVSAPAFVPFLGAFITMKEMPADVETEADVAIFGPLVGTLAAFAVYFWALAEDSTLLMAVAYSGFFLNLFNLLPVSPLDGGRITAVLGPRMWLLGLPLLLGLFLLRPSATLVIIAVMAAPQFMQAWRYDPQAPENVAYYGVPPQVKFEFIIMYLGLAVVLAIMTDSVHTLLEGVRLAR